MALTRVAPAGIGSTPGTGYVIGDSFLHSRGLNATDGYYTGIVTTQSLRVIGDLEVEGTTTTLDTALTEVDKLEVGANNNTVGVAITQSGTGDILNLYDGGTEVFTVKDGGNVGIGTDNTIDQLTLGHTNNQLLGFETDNEPTIQSYNAKLHINTAGNDVVFDGTGNLGIGTVSPVAKLDIITGTGDGTQNEANCLRLRQRGINGNSMTLQMGVNPAAVGALNQGYAYLQGRFWGGGNNPILLNPKGGNVGIGRTQAYATLDVNGDTILRTAGQTTQGDIGRKLGFTGPNGTTNPTSYIAGVADKTHWYQGFGLVFGTVSGNDISATLGVERMRISSDGDVGIGITIPRSKLDVTGSIFVSAGNQIQITGNPGTAGLQFVGNDSSASLVGTMSAQDLLFRTNSSEKMRITSDGKVGIGSDNPGQTLSIAGSSAGLGIYNTGNNHGNVYFFKDGTAKGWLKYRGNDDKLVIGNVTDAINVLSSGNVAIGHDSAPTKLGIRGTSASTDATVQIVGNNVSTLLLGQDAAGGVIRGQGGSNQLKFKVGGSGDDAAATGGLEALRITSAGFIGINQTSPNAPLSFNTGLGQKIELYNSGSGNEFGLGVQNSELRISSGSGSVITFRTGGYSGTERLRIDADGTILTNAATIDNTSSHGVIVAHAPASNADTGYKSIEIGNSNGSGNSRGSTICGQPKSNSHPPYTLIGCWDTGSKTDVYYGGGWGSNMRPAMQHRFYTNSSYPTANGSGTERIRIAPGGWLNIGGNFEQSSYTAQVTRIGGNTDVVQIKGNVGNSFIRFTDNDASSDFSLGADDAVGSNGFILYDRNDSAYRLIVDTNGYLGINHTSPGTRLVVKQNNGVAYNNRVQSQAYGAAAFINESGHTSGGTYTGFQFNLTGDSQNRICSIGMISEASNSRASSLVFATDEGGNRTEKLRITSAGKVGINNTNPQTTLNVQGTISTGRNLAREVGTVISASTNFNSSRDAENVLNGKKNYENGSNDWLTAGNNRDNANLVIDLGAQYDIDRVVIYNQNEYSDSRREVKRFNLEGSNDNSSWTLLIDDELGRSDAHEPNPGFSFRLPHVSIPGGMHDDSEGVSYRYWRFTMKDFHGSDPYGGIMEIELYGASNAVDSEVTTHSLVAGDVYTQTLSAKRLAIGENGALGDFRANANESVYINAASRFGQNTSDSSGNASRHTGWRMYGYCPDGVNNRLQYTIDGFYGRKSFYYYFPNGSANQAIRFHSNRNSFWTCGFITINGNYSHQNASGMLRYHFRHNANGSSNYGKSIAVDVNIGYTSGNFGMSDSYTFKGWGSNGGSATSHALELRHLNSAGNGCYVTIELYGNHVYNYIDDLYMTTGHTY